MKILMTRVLAMMVFGMLISLPHPTRAGYDPNKIILIDSNLAYYVGSNKFPTSSKQIDC